MAILRLCCAPCCSRPREEGSRYCSKHRESYEEKERERYKAYLERRFDFKNKTITPDRQKLYQSAEYKRKRKIFIEQNQCALCNSPAEELHHEWPVGYDYYNPTDFMNEEHWIPLCSYHHRQVSNSRKKELKNDIQNR